MLNSTVHTPLNSTAANINNSFEIIALQFRDNVEFADQEAAMANLNTVVKTAAGFQSRDYYYSEENGHWIEFIVWDNEASAKAASANMMKNEDALAVFSLVEQTTMLFSNYQHKGGTAA
ncbi:MAG: hypothetical protein COA68_04190 [Oceanobacter sp.]|nr:MAG: hypothetical protein COA68_04190 [Oceanobacter sp.]